MNKRLNLIALRSCLVYAILGGVWIFSSDLILERFITDAGQLAWLEMHKGTYFIIFTSVLLFFILRRSVAKEQTQIAMLKQAEALTVIQMKTLEMIALGQPLQTTLKNFLQRIEAEFPEMVCSIYLLDSEGKRLSAGVAPSLPEEVVRATEGVLFSPQTGSRGMTANPGPPVFSSDIATDPMWAEVRDFVLPHKIRSCWFTPMFDEHTKILGSFVIYQRTTGLPKPEQVRVIEMVTHTAATAIIKNQAETSLRENEEKFKALFEQASDAIYVHDFAGKIITVNHAACESLGYTKSELEKLLITDVEAGYEASKLKKVWEEFKPGLTQILRGQHRRKNGTVFPVEVSLSCCKIRGRTVMLAMARNITERNEFESRLAASEESYRNFFNTVSDAIYVLDHEGKFLAVNDGAVVMYGHPKDFFVGKTPEFLSAPGHNDMTATVTAIQETFAGEPQQFEWWGVRANGEIFPKEVKLKKGVYFGHDVIFATGRDITQRKRMEDNLRTASERAQFYMDRMPLAFVAWDRDFRVAEWNVAAEKIFGWTAREAIGRHAFDLIVPRSIQPHISRVWDEIVRTGSLVSHSINENITRDGRHIICDWRNTPWRDTEGNICGCLSLVGDITDQKQAEEKFAREQARFKLIFDSVPVGISLYTTRPDGSVTHTVNDAQLRNNGLTFEQNSELNAHEKVTHPEDLAIQNQFMDKIRTGQLTHFTMEKRFVHTDGKVVWVDFSYQLEKYPDGTLEELVTTVDITERKRLEEQLRQSQKMEAIGQLSGGIAHDFNNILTVIQGNASMLLGQSFTPEETRDCADQITRAADRAAGLTRQLLMFARRQQLQPTEVNLNEVVSQITKMLQRILGEDITLRTEFSPALPMVLADIGMIEQVVLNLAVNARDAMSDGGRLVIRTRTEVYASENPAAGDLFVQLHVSDTGTGIPPEILPRIFEPFFTTKEVGKGTGLGLATVYGIVQQHHGKISVQSQPGNTAFTISFPAIKSTSQGGQRVQGKTIMPYGTETILVVEDELPLRSFVSDLLQRCGYKVLEAASGRAAQKIWNEHRAHVSLLFTDIIMPEGLNGLDLGRSLLAEKPSLKVIYTSGYTGNVENRRQLELVEGVNYLRKPYKPDALAGMIRRVLDEPMPASQQEPS